eukprot:scaffold144077_cov31-Tisochrysis_lutea.AAC.1
MHRGSRQMARVKGPGEWGCTTLAWQSSGSKAACAARILSTTTTNLLRYRSMQDELVSRGSSAAGTSGGLSSTCTIESEPPFPSLSSASPAPVVLDRPPGRHLLAPPRCSSTSAPFSVFTCDVAAPATTVDAGVTAGVGAADDEIVPEISAIGTACTSGITMGALRPAFKCARSTRVTEGGCSTPSCDARGIEPLSPPVRASGTSVEYIWTCAYNGESMGTQIPRAS